MRKTEYMKVLEMYFVPSVKPNSVFTFEPQKLLIFTTGKVQNQPSRVNIPLKKQKPSLILFAGDRTCCCAKTTSRNYEKPMSLLK